MLKVEFICTMNGYWMFGNSEAYLLSSVSLREYMGLDGMGMTVFPVIFLSYFYNFLFPLLVSLSVKGLCIFQKSKWSIDISFLLGLVCRRSALFEVPGTCQFLNWIHNCTILYWYIFTGNLFESLLCKLWFTEIPL